MSCLWWTECGRIFNLAMRGAALGATACAAIFGAALVGYDAEAAEKPKLGLGSKQPGVVQPKNPVQPRLGNGNGKGGVGVVTKADGTKPKFGIAPATFDIQLGTKEFESYGKEIVVNTPAKVRFRMVAKVATVTGAKWQVSEQPFSVNGPVPPLKAEGQLAKVPTKIGYQEFVDINFQGIMPATAPSQHKPYYVRLVVTSNAYPQGQALPHVVVKHVKAGAPPKFTTKGLMPELWNPMGVEVKLSSLSLVKADESDEEPFLIAFVLWVDGTTINPLNFPGSSVRIDSPTKVHGNLPQEDKYGNDLSTGDWVSIPGMSYHRTILPIGLDVVDFPGVGPDLLMDNTRVYVVVLALEEDATADSAAQAARDALANGMKNEVNGIIKGMKLGQTPSFDLKAIQTKLQDQAISAAKANTLSGMWNPIGAMLALDDLIDPDDFIGAGVQSFTYKQLKNAPNAGLKIELNMQGNGGDHYRVHGTIRRTTAGF